MHPQMGIDVANHKINVITEKPMGINVESADRLIRPATRIGQTLCG